MSISMKIIARIVLEFTVLACLWIRVLVSSKKYMEQYVVRRPARTQDQVDRDALLEFYCYYHF